MLDVSLAGLVGLKLFALYLGLSLAMLAVFVRLYISITPYHEPTEIASGKLAPAIALSGAMLGFTFPLLFTWTLPPLTYPPDLLVLATEIAGVGGLDLPVEVSAIDSFPSVTDAPERSLSIVARIALDLSDVYMNNDASVAQALDRCKHVSLFLLDRADAWLDDDDSTI